MLSFSSASKRHKFKYFDCFWILWKIKSRYCYHLFHMPGIDTDPDPDRNALVTDADPDLAKWCGTGAFKHQLCNILRNLVSFCFWFYWKIFCSFIWYLNGKKVPNCLYCSLAFFWIQYCSEPWTSENFFQCSGSVTFWNGSGSADTFDLRIRL